MIYSVVSCQNMNNNQLASQPASPGCTQKQKAPTFFLFFSQPNDNTEINLKKREREAFPFCLKQTHIPLLPYCWQLYHEGAVISLLELLLYHSAACEALGDSIVDLLDYCHRTLLRSAAASASSRNHPSLADSPILKHLDVSHLEANIAIRCIAILRFLAGHADNLSEIVTSRMLTTTDVPLLAVQLLMDQQPWIRRVRRQSDGDDESGSRNDDDEMLEIYDNGQWRRCSHDEASGSSGGQIHPVAAHLWLLLLSLLMSPVAPRKYDLNDFRCQQLLKLRSSLNPYVIDQIPPLAEFEQWLVQLSIVGAHQVWRHSGSSLQKPFILELVAEMRQLMLKQLAAEWTAILDGQRQFLSDESPETIHRLAAIYDPEHLEATFDHCTSRHTTTEPTTTTSAAAAADAAGRQTNIAGSSTCTLCAKPALHRCSRCRRQHYCSKECQVADWPNHNSDCKPALKPLTRRDGGHLNLLLQQQH
ncbi:zinc finger MYND domain-containing protein 10-like isoform X3 [Daphnia pulicaria]|nr:zinc finger MYND domain-containing protein 10-like isoform X3 [Daphnia pulicaria]